MNTTRRLAVVALTLCAISAALSIVSLTHAPLDSTWRSLHSSDAFLTSAFWVLVLPATLLHSSWHHLAPNLILCLLLGTAVERRIGALWSIAFVLFCSIAPTGLELWYSGRPQVGISGIDYAFLGFLLPNPPPIRFGLWLACAVILLGWLFAGMIYPISPENPPGNVSHFSGLLFGIAAGLLFRSRRQNP
jgi:membrane associated rhomboid family serine protease